MATCTLTIFKFEIHVKSHAKASISYVNLLDLKIPYHIESVNYSHAIAFNLCVWFLHALKGFKPTTQ